MKKIVVCPDSFKESVSATEASFHIALFLERFFPDASVIKCPLADGGEGTMDILRTNLYSHTIHEKAHDPLGRPILVPFLCDYTGKKFFIESAAVIGLPLLKDEEKNPLHASSRGLGEIIMKAIKRGAEEITVSLGGSATCDAGIGMLDAMNEIPENIKFHVLCDVSNPLLGNNGAAYVFSPQKGAGPGDIPLLENRLSEFASYTILTGKGTKEDIYKEGAGAAGGLGFTFLTHLKALHIKGIDFILKTLNFDEIIKDARLIITGEGKIDSQSLMGKVVDGVLRKACPLNIPVIALAGKVEDLDKLKKSGIDRIISIEDPFLDHKENLKKEITVRNIEKSLSSNIGYISSLIY